MLKRCTCGKKTRGKALPSGRVRLGEEGINGTIGGSVAAVMLYISAMRSSSMGSNLCRCYFKDSPADTGTGFPFVTQVESVKR